MSEPTTYRFGVTVSDSLGKRSMNDLWWTVTVQPASEPNTAPQIVGVTPSLDSDPLQPPDAYERRGYALQVVADDAEGDRLQYFLDGPDGMEIDRNTGRIIWLPQAGDVGDNVQFTVRVVDGKFVNPSDPAVVAEAMHTFTIDVHPKATTNNRPHLDSILNYVILPEQPFVYPVKAYDPNGDELTYELADRPDGMVIDPKTGVLSWTPIGVELDDVYTVTVVVSDGLGGTDSTAFAPWVIDPNTDPVFDSDPNEGGIDRDYEYHLRAHDDEGDPLTYSLLDGPPGMFVDNDVLEWPASEMRAGEHHVVVGVEDGRGGSAYQEFFLTISQILAAPTDRHTQTDCRAGRGVFVHLHAQRRQRLQRP